VVKYLNQAPEDTRAYLYSMHPQVLKWLANAPRGLVQFLRKADGRRDLQRFMQGIEIHKLSLRNEQPEVIEYIKTAPPQVIRSIQTPLNPFNDYIRNFELIAFIQNGPKELAERRATDIYTALRLQYGYFFVKQGPKELLDAKPEEVYRFIRGEEAVLAAPVKDYLAKLPEEMKKFVSDKAYTEKEFRDLWKNIRDLTFPASLDKYLRTASKKVREFVSNDKLDAATFGDTWLYLTELQKLLPKTLVDRLVFVPLSLFPSPFELQRSEMGNEVILLPNYLSSSGTVVEVQMIIQGDKSLPAKPAGLDEALNKLPPNVKEMLEAGLIEKVRLDDSIKSHLDGLNKDMTRYLEFEWVRKLDAASKEYLKEVISRSLDYLTSGSEDVFDYFRRGFPFGYEKYRTAAVKWAKTLLVDTCAKCHFIDNKYGATSYEAAPDLLRVGERFRPRWLDKWIHEPGNIYPRVVMPKWPRESADNVAGGPHVAHQALIEYLLTFQKYK
jgi:hypothetical protein